MLLLELTDGTQIGITDCTKDLPYDLLGDGIINYDSRTGILTSNVALSCGLDADNYEITGPLGDTATLEAIVGGRFNRARAWLFLVNWQDLTDGAIKLLAGTVTEARVQGGKFMLEIRSDMDLYNQTVGRLITNNCDADFADQVRCFATATEVAATVVVVTSALQFTVVFSGTYADNFFNKGTVEFLTGNLVGTQKIEIEDWTGLGVIHLFAPAVEAPAVGDTLTLRDGCGKSRVDCMAHDAIEWFRGYPEVPGADQVLRAAIAGRGDQ